MNSKHSLILASSSPRRQALLRMAGYTFTVVQPAVDENYADSGRPAAEIAGYLAKKKALSIKGQLSDNEMVLAADTTVVMGEIVFAKPANRNEAVDMLMQLSDKTHTVITGVCLLSQKKMQSFDDRTKVIFRKLKREEITYYVDHFHPFDKAGGYGIQEWIGMVAIKAIHGCYFNVVGLPVQKVYTHIENF